MKTTYCLLALFIVIACETACSAETSQDEVDDQATSVEGLPQELCVAGSGAGECNDEVLHAVDTGVHETGQFTGNGQCYAYKDASFRGSSQALQEGWTYTNVGGSFNDQISSFRVAAANCVILAWSDINERGSEMLYNSDTTNVGGDFNDRISSWSCSCD